MAITPTYPGVYVQEIPSGVRSISGVGTAIALFVGRTKQGPLNKPVLCLGYTDFERVFSKDTSQSELAHAVRLFFANGGSQCYVMRIANGADTAKVTLKNEENIDVLLVEAKEAGQQGNMIRMAITYSGNQPESTFNLEVFQWVQTAQGTWEKGRTEMFSALTMEPNTGRYAPTVINTNSNLIQVTDVHETATPPSPPATLLAEGYSLSGRALTEADLVTTWNGLGTNRKFCISVDAQPFVEVAFSEAAVAAAADIATEMETKIRANVPNAGSVNVTLVNGPNDETPALTKMLQISSPTGDILIEAASSNDLATPMMFGTARGGLELSRYSVRRPAPTGIVFNPDQRNALSNLLDAATGFATQQQDHFTDLTLGSTSIQPSIQTLAASNKMYQDGNNGEDGVREKWNIIATAINNEQASNPNFPWKAEVWGSRLALIPVSGGDNDIGTLTTAANDISSLFLTNVRYYSLGSSGQGTFQNVGTSGNDGIAPQLSDYQAAYTIAERDIDLFNLLILPKDHDHSSTTTQSLWGPASEFCRKHRAFMLMDAPSAWKSVSDATDFSNGVRSLRTGLVKDHSALFFPRLLIREGRGNIQVGPSGAIAGLMARIDSARGVWKAPAGTEADLRGIVGVEQRFSDAENGVLNPRAINTIRVLPNGIVNWGARTMDGDDDFGSEYKYIPIRRLALFLEESLYRGLQWVVFEPNDEPLWSQIRLNVGAFLHDLFRQGAFQGKTPQEAYFVKCDAETTTQSDRNRGIVNVVVGFAPLKPAEFVILSLQQIAGEVAP